MLFARRARKHVFSLNLFLCLAFLGSAQLAVSQEGTLNPSPRIVDSIDETQLVTLKGNTHPLALAKYDQGPVSDSLPMEHMYLQLKRSPGQEKALEALLADMQNPQSPSYHKWLTADQVGKLYGPSQQDIDKVVSWLNYHGMQVNGVSKSGLTIDVSGTAGQVRETFHTTIHKYAVKGKQHIANASDPQIPSALATLVAGFNSLNDFMPKPAIRKPTNAFSFNCTNCSDGFNDQELYDEAPSDFATIYNVTPLYKERKAITGKGQTVAVLELTDINSADVATFRRAFGLGSYHGKFTQVHPGPGCSDPGKNGAESEAALDSEWAGAVAPDANVELASCADTATNSGIFIAAQNLLDRNSPPPIMSLSYIGCEADEGPSGNLFIDEIWEQAALEGVSVFVAAGDGGAAGCDDFDSAPYATNGIAANGLASTPFDTATGGTDFLDTADNENAKYWNPSNSATGESAKSYIPETPWNTSCASSLLYTYYGYTSGLEFCNASPFLDIVAGSGAPSFVYAKPYWQKNIYGNPSDGVRDLPDVSLFASNAFWFHAILYCMSDANEGGSQCNYATPADAFNNSAGGTSFTAPQFASIQALINQKAGGPQGNAAPMYYDLGRAEYGTASSPNNANLSACKATLGKSVGSSCMFRDVTAGNIDVPCYGTNDCFGSGGVTYGVLSTSDAKEHVAYPAQSGWDFATGLGTVNVTNVVNNWP